MSRFTPELDELNHAYGRLHTAKEDAFWTAYMGLGDDAQAARAELDHKEIELARFLRDPARLARMRALAAEARAAGSDASEAERTALAGWSATFAVHVIDDPRAQALADEIVAAEGRLANERAQLQLDYARSDGVRVPASSVKLGVLINSDPDAGVRRSAWEALQRIEPHVLEHGFLDVVRERNRLGRMLGGDDYYDWKVQRVEGMRKAEVFALLDELEERTRASALAAVERLRGLHGAAVTPWNVRFLVSGDVSAEQDPYFPFAKSLERWGRSFAALGIEYRDATLVLDLVDRPGKYENGFMHGPVVAWRERGRLHPARIQFTANAIPNMLGAGRRALETLFHEGGHAAHFANVDMPAPCFGQEFAPTSVAFSETQSMLLDSLIGDADWQTRYARDLRGNALPQALIEKGIRATQPFAAWNLRAMLTVPYAERALYEIPERELTTARVLAALRDVERRLLFLDEGSPRPVLSVPHLISGESSAYYHGYVLAEMAVQQTRAFFEQRDGHLVDNPRVGPALRDVYWKPGNSRSFRTLIADLCGRPLSAADLAQKVNRDVEQAIDAARERIRRAATLPPSNGKVELGARIRVAHGRETIASTDDGGFDGCCARFERWIAGLAPAQQ